jgi:hypothetical protein
MATKHSMSIMQHVYHRSMRVDRAPHASAQCRVPLKPPTERGRALRLKLYLKPTRLLSPMLKRQASPPLCRARARHVAVRVLVKSCSSACASTHIQQPPKTTSRAPPPKIAGIPGNVVGVWPTGTHAHPSDTFQNSPRPRTPEKGAQPPIAPG